MSIYFRIINKTKIGLTKIRVDVSNGRNNKAAVTTPLSVPPKYWDKKRQRVVQKGGFDVDYTGINDSLNKLEKYLNLELSNLAQEGGLITSKWLKNCVKDILNPDNTVKSETTIISFIDSFVSKLEKGEILTIKGEKYAKGTINGYKQLTVKLNEYSKNQLTFSKIDREFGSKFIDFLTKQDLSKNYIGKIISRLKSVMTAARKDGLVKNIEYLDFTVYKETADNIYLTLDEIEKINTLDIRGAINKDFNPSDKELVQYEIVKDIFVFACYTGQRISDYRKIKEHNFTKDGEHYVLTLTQLKTGKKVSVPLRREPLLIAEKYKFSLSTIPEQKINEKIKILGKLAGINDEVEVKITRGGKVNKTVYKKYELIKTHTARRSFITNMVLSEEFPRSQMMSISGHSTEKDFNNYVKAGYKEYLKSMLNSKFFNNY